MSSNRDHNVVDSDRILMLSVPATRNWNDVPRRNWFVRLMRWAFGR